MTWLRTNADGAAAVFDLRPEAHAGFNDLYAGLWNEDVDEATLDACRDRIAAVLAYAPDPTADRDLSPAARAAVAYAEQYALDPHGLRDADFVALHEHYTDAQLATLTLAVAMFDALARFSTALEA
jgi:alkylhydroperoxidase family enzyme